MKKEYKNKKWVLFYLKLWNMHLYLKKIFLLLELKCKQSKKWYRVKMILLSPFSWKKKVDLLESQKKYSQVIHLCHRKIKNQKLLPELYEIIGRNLRNLNKIDEARDNFRKAQQLKSNSPSLYYELGLIHFIKREYSYARNAMEKAIKKGYDTAPLRIHLGKVYYQMGMFDRAEDCFKRVLDVYPQEGSIYFLLGIVYKSKIEYQLAIEAFSNAVKYGSNQKEEHLGLAEIYTRLGYWDKAIREYEAILEYEPDNFVAHYFLGWIFEIQGFEDKAIREYIIANKINPDDEDTKLKLTQILATPVSIKNN